MSEDNERYIQMNDLTEKHITIKDLKEKFIQTENDRYIQFEKEAFEPKRCNGFFDIPNIINMIILVGLIITMIIVIIVFYIKK